MGYCGFTCFIAILFLVANLYTMLSIDCKDMDLINNVSDNINSDNINKKDNNNVVDKISYKHLFDNLYNDDASDTSSESSNEEEEGEEEEEDEEEEEEEEESIKLRFYKLLDNNQKNIYKKIIDERKSIYFRGYGIGLTLSFIFIFIYKYILRPSKKSLSIWFLVCLTGAITFTTNYLFYILAPKSTYMINHLKNKQQIRDWQNIYRTMQVKYNTGLVLGIFAIMIFAYANRC